MVVDFRRVRGDPPHLNINGSAVEIVQSTKFLSIHITENLTWSLNTSSIAKKTQQRLYFLRRLRKPHLPPPILTMFYRGTVESILSSCIIAWFGNSNASDRKTLQRIVRTTEEIIEVSLPSVTDIHTTRCTRKARSIMKDPTHPSHGLFSLLPSGRRWDYSPLLNGLCLVCPMLYKGPVMMEVSGSLGETVSMSCSPQTVCALRESVVKLMCSYSGTVNPQQSFWFSQKQSANWRNEDDPEDLALDSDYAGRVSSNHTGFGSTLTITDLRETDSGDYHLMIITGGGEKDYSSAVRLTVSDLQVTMSRVTQTELRTTCSTSCSVTPEPSYLWYKDGRYVEGSTRQRFLFSSSVPYSVSCSAATHSSEVRSSSVCVFGEDCWNVSYSDRRLCVLEGSSVDVLCIYSHPSTHTVTEVFWYYSDPNGKLKDLKVEERFAGRVEFLGDKKGNCSLRMRDVRKSDSGEYRFRFITKTAGGEFSGTPGVVLKVTDLQVRASPSSPPEGQTVTLTCTSTCTLPNNPTYIWYKNGEPVTNKPTKSNKLYLESASSEELHQYSCALGDRGQNDTTATPTPTTPSYTTLNPNTGRQHSDVVKLVAVAVSVPLTVILVTGSVWMCFVIKRKRTAGGGVDVQASKPGDDTYTALNPVTMSSDYDTLT
ncbi:hypothetical protein NFI96_012191, partial [Prochilodus magdalenae]